MISSFEKKERLGTAAPPRKSPSSCSTTRARNGAPASPRFRLKGTRRSIPLRGRKRIRGGRGEFYIFCVCE